MVALVFALVLSQADGGAPATAQAPGNQTPGAINLPLPPEKPHGHVVGCEWNDGELLATCPDGFDAKIVALQVTRDGQSEIADMCECSPSSTTKITTKRKGKEGKGKK